MNAVVQLKQPPASAEAEQAVLGACLLRPELFHELVLTETDFYRADNRLVWRAIASLAETHEAFDAVTVSEWLEEHKLAEDAGGLAYVATIARDTPTAANGKLYAEIVRERSRKREMLRLLGEAQEGLYGLAESAETAATLQAKLESLNRTGGDLGFRELLGRGVESMAAAKERREKGDPGLVFNVPALDKILGGLTGGKLVILAGRPSTGKTALAHQLAMIACRRGVPVGKIELEMSAEEIAHRSIAYAYGLNVTQVARGELIREITLAAAEHNIRDYPLWTDERAFTLPEICSRITEWRRTHKIELAVVDYLQLIATHGDNRAQAIGDNTRGLKLLAKRLGIPVVVLCQFNRANVKSNERPSLVGLRDSGEIEADAHIVIGLHGELEADEEGNRSVEIGVLKNRGGRVGWLDHDRFRFCGRYQRFEEISDDNGSFFGRSDHRDARAAKTRRNADTGTES